MKVKNVIGYALFCLMIAVVLFSIKPTMRLYNEPMEMEKRQQAINDLTYNFKITVFSPASEVFYSNEPPQVSDGTVIFRDVVGGHVKVFSGFAYTVEVLGEE